MPNILTKDVEGTPFSPIEALLVAGSKVTTEALLSRVGFVGNGSLRSGAIKMVGAFALGSFVKNKFGKVVATGLMVDGAEDLVGALVGRFLPSAESSRSQAVGGNNANIGAGVGMVI